MRRWCCPLANTGKAVLGRDVRKSLQRGCQVPEDRDRGVCILGMGYVGLTLAVAMAECGYRVVGVEVDPIKAHRLANGEAHFFEAGLNSRLACQVSIGNLAITSEHDEMAVESCAVFVVTVGTPLDSDGQPRMDMVERASGQVAEVMQEGALVILRSTVQLGTTRKVAKPILDASGKPYHLAYCPERTIEGKALEELRSLPQIVGGLNDEASWRAAQIFQRVTPTTIRVSSLEAAEIVKLLDNSYRDLSFAFGNEAALMCEAASLDGLEVIHAANTGYDRTAIAAPGLVGGPCLEKDPHILRASMAEYGCVPRLVTTGRQINEGLPVAVIDLLEQELSLIDRKQAQVAVCGLAYKGRPETDDLRGTPARYLISALRDRLPRSRLVGQDFAVDADGIRGLGLYPVGIEEAFRGSSMVIIANNNRRYTELDIDSLASSMDSPGVIFDMWDCLQPQLVLSDRSVSVFRLGAVNAQRRA